jgi:hypothetical protein
MSLIPQLRDSIDRRLDQLATEISSLEGARTALSTPPAARRPTGETSRRHRFRPGPRTPAASAGGQSAATAPSAASATSGASGLTATTAPGTSSQVTKPRARRAAKPATRKRATRSLTSEELGRMLAQAASGLSATDIAQEAETAYNSTLTLLRRLESDGQVAGSSTSTAMPSAAIRSRSADRSKSWSRPIRRRQRRSVSASRR